MKKFEIGLEKIKKDYEKLKSKYNLPAFTQLNDEFEIDRVSERETENLLREVRKAMAEKIVAFLRFFETMLNPSNAPFFIFSIIKNLSNSDKKIIEEVYEALCDFEISALELDVDYSEKKEAEFIKQGMKKWKEVKPKMIELCGEIKRAWKTSSEKHEKGYFG